MCGALYLVNDPAELHAEVGRDLVLVLYVGGVDGEHLLGTPHHKVCVIAYSYPPLTFGQSWKRKRLDLVFQC